MAGKYIKKSLKMLTGIIMGGAIGSILGMTLSPRTGKENREMIREKSMEMFLKGKKMIEPEKKPGLLKRAALKLLRKNP